MEVPQGRAVCERGDATQPLDQWHMSHHTRGCRASQAVPPTPPQRAHTGYPGGSRSQAINLTILQLASRRLPISEMRKP